MTQKEVLTVITEYERLRCGEVGTMLIESDSGNKAYLALKSREVYGIIKK